MEILFQTKKHYLRLKDNPGWPWGLVVLAGLLQGLAMAVMMRGLVSNGWFGWLMLGGIVFNAALNAVVIWVVLGLGLGVVAGFRYQPLQVLGLSFQLLLLWSLLSLPIAAFFPVQVPPFDASSVQSMGELVRLHQDPTAQFFRLAWLAITLVQLGVSRVGLEAMGCPTRKAWLSVGLVALGYGVYYAWVQNYIHSSFPQ